MGRARAEVGAADAQRRTYLSYVLPRIGATGGLIRNSDEVSFGGSDFQRVILPLNDWNLRLTVQQPVFAGLREQRAYQQAKEGVRSAELGVRATEDRILLRTAADYIQVVGGDALVKVEEQAIALARDRLREARNFFEAGETTRVDVLRAESAAKAAERRLALARRDRGTALGQLRVDLNLDGDFEVGEPALSLPARPDEALLLQQAVETRAEVRQAKSALRIAELEVSKQKGAYLPTVTADAGYVWQKTSFPTDQYGYAALRFVVPIWQSGEISSRVAFARERERQARLALEEQLRTVQEDVRRALLDLRDRDHQPRPVRGPAPGRGGRVRAGGRPLSQPGGDFARHPVLRDEPERRATRGRGEPPGAPLLRARGVLRRRRSQVRRPQGGKAVTFRPTTALALLALASPAGRERAPQKAETSATPPPLPDDVQSVEAVAQPPAATAPGTDALTAGGRLSLTGELVAPIRSDLVPRTAVASGGCSWTRDSGCARASRSSSWRPSTSGWTWRAPRPTSPARRPRPGTRSATSSGRRASRRRARCRRRPTTAPRRGPSRRPRRARPPGPRPTPPASASPTRSSPRRWTVWWRRAGRTSASGSARAPWPSSWSRPPR